MHLRAARSLVPLCLSVGLAASAAASPSAVLLEVAGRSLTAADARARWERLPELQRQSFGAAPQAALSAFLAGPVTSELLLAAEAQRRGVQRTERYAALEQEVLRRAVEDDVRRSALRERPVTEGDVAQEFETLRQELERPERIRIWQIVVPTQTRALEIVAEARGPNGLRRWGELARTDSTDHSNHLRNGDLGFVRADGSTDVPLVRTHPALYAAVASVPDGELLSDPLELDGTWRVLWRRGSLPARPANLEASRAAIRQRLEHRAAQRALADLTARLRVDHLRDLDPKPLSLPLPQPPPIISPRPPAEPHSAELPPGPTPGPDALR